MPSRDLPGKEAPFEVLAASATGLLALLTLIGWLIGNEPLAALGLPSVPMGGHAAFLVLLLSVATILVAPGVPVTSARTIRTMVWLITGLALLDLLAVLNIFPDVILLNFTVPSRFPEPGISLETAVSLIFLSISLGVLSLPPASRVNAAAGIVLAFLAIGVSLFALYGNIESDAGQSWNAVRRISTFTQLMVFALSSVVVMIAWKKFRGPGATLTEILRGMQLICGGLLFLTVLLSACIAVFPLYDSVLGAAYLDVQAFLPRRQADLMTWLSSFHTAASSIDARAESFRSIPAVESVEEVSPEVSDPAAWRSGLWWKTDDEGDLQLFVDTIVPAAIGRRSVMRARIVTEAFLEMFLERPPAAARRGKLYIFSKASPDLVIKAAGTPLRADVIKISDIPPNLKQRVRGESRGLSDESPLRAILNSRPISLLSGESGSNVLIGFSSNPTPVPAMVKKKVIPVAIALFVLVIASSAVILFIIGKLVKQISLLESRLRQSLFTVEEELALRERAQAEAEHSLKEKEVLLKEVHHRVKNNLQVVSSILSLQFRRHPNAKDAVSLEESANRIKSIALLHEALYHSKSLTRITLSNYFSQIIENLRRSYESGAYVDVRLETGDILLEMDRAIPLGLIVTELLSNSFKYAFPSEKRMGARVKIRVTDEDCECLRFVYSDNGVGFPLGFSTQRVHSLGWRLITMLVQQLKGQISVFSNGGANVEIRFPENKDGYLVIGERSYDEKAAHISC